MIRMCLLSTVLFTGGTLHATPRGAKWTPDQALAWQTKQPWFVGCNHLPYLFSGEKDGLLHGRTGRRMRPALFLCAEFLTRPSGSTFQDCLPGFKERKAGAICWGLVRGRTNTIWGWKSKEGPPEPEVWFHDVLHPDGTPYMPVEIETIRQNQNSQQ